MTVPDEQRLHHLTLDTYQGYGYDEDERRIMLRQRRKA
jgi:hypothetical protein